MAVALSSDILGNTSPTGTHITYISCITLTCFCVHRRVRVRRTTIACAKIQFALTVPVRMLSVTSARPR